MKNHYYYFFSDFLFFTDYKRLGHNTNKASYIVADLKRGQTETITNNNFKISKKAKEVRVVKRL